MMWIVLKREQLRQTLFLQHGLSLRPAHAAESRF